MQYQSLLQTCANLHAHNTGFPSYPNGAAYAADVQSLMQTIRDWKNVCAFDEGVLALLQITLTECELKFNAATQTAQHNIAAQAAFTSPLLHLYVDGACPGNGSLHAKSGIGVVVCDSNNSVLRSFGQSCPAPHTNQRAEIQAAIAGLNSIEPTHTVKLFSDSQYLVKTINDGWARRTNTDLWAQLDIALARFDVPPTFTWIKGHSGHPQQQIADQLAVQAAR